MNMTLALFVFLIFLNCSVDARLDVIRLTDIKTNGTRYWTYSLPNGTSFKLNVSSPTSQHQQEVDCFGFGETVAKGLVWLQKTNVGKSNNLDVTFSLTTRRNRNRSQIFLGDRFDLEYTNFKIERKTIMIVHGFLSHSEEQWLLDMEKAFLDWRDVNVVTVDWSAHGNTWNYYGAVVNARTVAEKIVRFLSHVINATREITPDESKWGMIHMVGHSLGAHICGKVAYEFKKIRTTWKINRITGLDPAQPCFKNTDLALDKSDAPFVDVIHTNGKFLSSIGLGLPDPIGHVDFYPNGGQSQPGCARVNTTLWSYLGIPDAAIEQAICSHGRSYFYFTESIIAASDEKENKCKFWGHSWDRSYQHGLQILNETCNTNTCIEMGIEAEKYEQRGTFFVITSSVTPFCDVQQNDRSNVVRQLKRDFSRV